MSVVYCHYCDEQIDLDYHAEHFIYETGQCAAEAYETAGRLAGDRGTQLDLQRQAATQYCTAGAIDRGRDLFANVMRGVGLQPTESSVSIMLQLLGRRARLRWRGLHHVQRSRGAT